MAKGYKTIQRNWQQGTQLEEKPNKNTTEYVLDTTMRKQANIVLRYENKEQKMIQIPNTLVTYENVTFQLHLILKHSSVKRNITFHLYLSIIYMSEILKCCLLLTFKHETHEQQNKIHMSMSEK